MTGLDRAVLIRIAQVNHTTLRSLLEDPDKRVRPHVAYRLEKAIELTRNEALDRDAAARAVQPEGAAEETADDLTDRAMRTHLRDIIERLEGDHLAAVWNTANVRIAMQLEESRASPKPKAGTASRRAAG